MVGNSFPSHVHSHSSAEKISTAIDRGRYDGDDHAALWIDDDLRGQLGVVIMEDLADAGPMFDLRLAEIPRDAQDVSACRLCHRGALPRGMARRWRRCVRLGRLRDSSPRLAVRHNDSCGLGRLLKRWPSRLLTALVGGAGSADCEPGAR